MNTADLEPGTHYYTDNISADSVVFVMLTVAAAPDVQISGTTSIGYGQSTKLTASGALSYAWNIGENTAVVSVAPGHTTTYTVVGSVKGCQPDTATITVEVKNSGIGEAADDSSIELFPNPASNYAVISADEPMSSIAIYNSLGQLLQTIDAQGNTWLRLNTDKLSSGIYIIGVRTESNKWIRSRMR